RVWFGGGRRSGGPGFDHLGQALLDGAEDGLAGGQVGRVDAGEEVVGQSFVGVAQRRYRGLGGGGERDDRGAAVVGVRCPGDPAVGFEGVDQAGDGAG